MPLRPLDPGSATGQGLAPATDAAPSQVVLAFDDNRHASVLFGQYGQNLALIERRLGVVAEQRGNHVTLDGPRDGVEQARRVLESLYETIKRGQDLASGDVEGAIKEAFARKKDLVFLDFITDQTENVFPMVPGGKGLSEMILV